jgi:transcriptional regulator with XRE-family HTH domain
MRVWRASESISQAQLAVLLGVRAATISAWENDEPIEHPELVVLAMRALVLEFKEL